MKRYFMKYIKHIILLFLFLPCLSHAMWTPLHQAAMVGNLEQAQLLLVGGANVNAADLHGLIPLHKAASDGNEAMVQLLLDKDAKVNATDEKGRTPLHCAANAINGNEATARLLLARGAKIDATDMFGRTPLHVAESKNHTKLISLLACWQKLTKKRKEQMYTFLMATHSPNSPASKLPNELSQHIWQFVKPTIDEIDQEILQQKHAEQKNISNVHAQQESAQQSSRGCFHWIRSCFKKR